MKICSLITIRFYCVFQKCFIVDGFAILLLTLFQISLYFFNNSSSSIKKMHPFSLTIIAFYTCVCLTEKIFLDINMSSISTSFKKLDFYNHEISFVSTSLSLNVTTSLLISHLLNFCFLMFNFFRSR